MQLNTTNQGLITQLDFLLFERLAMYELRKIGLAARVNRFKITILVIPKTDSFISIKRSITHKDFL